MVVICKARLGEKMSANERESGKGPVRGRLWIDEMLLHSAPRQADQLVHS